MPARLLPYGGVCFHLQKAGMYHLGVREELCQNIMCYRLPERFLSTISSTQIPSTFKDFVAPYRHMLRQVTYDMQDNIQSGCN